MSDPWAINAAAGVPEYNAAELRRLEGALLFKGVVDRFGARQGVHPSNNPAVTVAGTTWTVQDITAVVYPGLSAQDGPYVVAHPSESAALTPADGTNPRIDALDLQVQDDDEDASGQRRAQVVYVTGTPAASPAAPAVTATSLRLATILVPAGGSPSPSVQTLAVFTVAAGGILPVRTAAELPAGGLYEGMTAFQQDTDALLVHDGSDFVPIGNAQGFQFGGRQIFASNDTFDKGDFPGLRAVDIEVQAGGGAGGGAASTIAGQQSAGGGGQGGAYARSFILASSLGASETVTVGAGGTGVSGGTGNTGGTSTVTNAGGSNVSAAGGAGGATAAASGNDASLSGATSAQAMSGDIQIGGGGGGALQRNNAGGSDNLTISGMGGTSFLGNGGRGQGTSLTGDDGKGYGGGGGGAANAASQSARAGGSGGPGRVIVTLYF